MHFAAVPFICGSGGSLFFQRIENFHENPGIEVGGCREVQGEPQEAELDKCIKIHQQQRPGETVDHRDDQGSGQVRNAQKQGIFQIIDKSVVKLTDQWEGIAQNQHAVDEDYGANHKQNMPDAAAHIGEIGNIYTACDDHQQKNHPHRGALPEILPESPEISGDGFAFPGSIQPENHIIQCGQRGSDGENGNAGA